MFTVDEVELTGGRGFGGGFVANTRNGSAQAEGFAGFGRFENQNFAFARSRGKIHPARANDEHAARILSFHEKNGSRRQNALMADQIKGAEPPVREPAEEMRAGQSALRAVLHNVDAIRRSHA